MNSSTIIEKLLKRIYMYYKGHYSNKGYNSRLKTPRVLVSLRRGISPVGLGLMVTFNSFSSADQAWKMPLTGIYVLPGSANAQS